MHRNIGGHGRIDGGASTTVRCTGVGGVGIIYIIYTIDIVGIINIIKHVRGRIVGDCVCSGSTCGV